MAYKIEEIEGIGPSFGAKLATANIKTTDDFLTNCCDAKGRKAAAEKTGIPEKHLLRWANHADLMRISGIGPQFAELLEAAGVDTVKELRTRNVANLTAKMAEVNEAKNLSGTAPTESLIGDWIEKAKTMEPTITH